MYVIFEYAIYAVLTSVGATSLFASCVAFLVVQKTVVLLGGIVGGVIQQRGQPTLMPLRQPTTQGM